MLATGLLLTTREEENQEALFFFVGDALSLLHIEVSGEQHGDPRTLNTSLSTGHVHCETEPGFKWNNTNTSLRLSNAAGNPVG